MAHVDMTISMSNGVIAGWLTVLKKLPTRAFHRTILPHDMASVVMVTVRRWVMH